jgi:hypothetical protein
MLMTKISFAQAWYFEYQSHGTYYPYSTIVSFTPDGKVGYIKTNNHTQKIHEKWEGKIDQEEMDAFVKELMDQCRFFDLPENSDEPIRIKDSSYDYFTLIYREKKHTIGGYAAKHDKVYKPVFETYSKMWGEIKNVKVLIDPKVK